MPACPEQQTLVDCLLGRLPDAQADTLLEHAEGCPRCSKLVAQLENSADHVTKSLRLQAEATPLPPECDRMISRAETYVQSELPAEPADDVKQHLLHGTKLRDYEIRRPLGEGGMGAVFLAHHARLDRDVALKVLSMRRASDVEAQQRFEQEMQMVGKLQHPNVVRALDGGEHEGVQYLVMELIDGVDLRQLVDAEGPVQLADACELCRQAALGLEYAHKQRLIHRDIKPSNLMLSSRGVLKVMDLGLARFTDQRRRSLTSTHQAMGSLDFMAPEQLRAELVDQRADVYALACTLHYLLTGEPPEKRRTASLMVSRNPRLDSLRDVLPPPLTRLMQQMLAADPQKRPSKMRDVIEELAPFCNQADLQQLSDRATLLSDDPTAGRPSSITSRVEVPPPPSGWNQVKGARWAGVATMLGLLGLALWNSQIWPIGKPPAGSGTARQLSSDQTVIDLMDLDTVSSKAEPPREVPLFQPHAAAVRCLAYVPESRQLICGSDDGIVSIRQLPDQPLLRVLNLSAQPIEQIVVFDNGAKFACLDQAGSIRAFSLQPAPDDASGGLLWHKPANREQERIRGINGLADQNLLAVACADGSLQHWNGDSGEIALQRKLDLAIRGHSPTSPSWMRLTLANGLQLNYSTADLQVGSGGQSAVPSNPQFLLSGKPVPAAPGTASATDRLCVLDGNLVRLADRTIDVANQFIYAEHDYPLTAVAAIERGQVYVTADKSGEVRLWQAPGRPAAKVVMACEVDVDAHQMTYELRNSGRWRLSAFAPAAPQQVRYDEHRDDMVMQTDLRRGQQSHTLEYRIY